MQDNEITSLIARLAHLKKQYPCLSYGEYREVYLTNRQYAYTRNLNDEMLLTVANNDENPVSFNIAIAGKTKADSLITGKEYRTDETIRIELGGNDSDVIILR